MARVTVEVDIDDLDIDDILDHIKYEYKNGSNRDKKTIAEFLNKINNSQEFRNSPSIITSAVDGWKDELWPIIKDKFSLEQLEAFLNS